MMQRNAITESGDQVASGVGSGAESDTVVVQCNCDRAAGPPGGASRR